MAVASRGIRERRGRDGEARGAQDRARREAEDARAERVHARFMEGVERDMLREIELRRADAKLTPEQRNEARLRRLEQPKQQLPEPSAGPARPLGWNLAREDIARGWKREAEEQRERDQRIPERRDEWDSAAQEINEAEAEAIRQAHEQHREALQAARDRADNERAGLGERPAMKVVAE